MSAWEKQKNLGPQSAAYLLAAGIESLAQLQAMGAVAAYLQVQGHAKVSKNLLWALEGCISGKPWQQVAREDRLRLLLELERQQKTQNER